MSGAGSLVEVTALAKEGSIARGWKWRERTGAMVSPADMETRHLFFTLRMIWNNRMPAHMRVGRNVRLYHFGPHYTQRYLAEAIIAIGSELRSRTDMTAGWLRELRQMQDRIGGHTSAAPDTKGGT